MSSKIFRIAIYFSLYFALCFFGARSSPVQAQQRRQPTIFIIGDSTVNNGTKGLQGWGTPISEFFNTQQIRIENRARGGRSSRTFLTEGLWEQVKTQLQPGDFVLMQFGHNDGGTINDDSRARGSIKGIGEEVQEIDNLLTKKHEIVHTYGWYLREFINDTKAKGATPIVLSLVARNIFKDGKIARGNNDWGKWAAEVAAATNTDFIDLNELTARRYEEVGAEQVKARYFLEDHTHTTPVGARLNAMLVVKGIQALSNHPLAKFINKNVWLGELIGDASAPTEPLSIWFRTPAKDFTQSLPLGNGRLGAMIFGGVNQERIVLNESSLWSGAPEDADRSDAAQYLPEIKRLLLAGKNDEAEKLVYEHFTCKGKGSNYARGKDAPYGSYQVLGNLQLKFPDKIAEASNYKRELNLTDATARVSYEQGGVKFTREIFVSAPDEAIIIRLTADKSGAINFAASLDRPERFTTVANGNNGLLISGQLNNGTDGNGMKYAARLHVQASGGTTNTDGNAVRVTNANEAIIFITAATNFRGFAGRQTANELTASANDLQKATTKNFAALLAAHKSDYQKYFNRVSLILPTNNETANLPTPARLRAIANGANDPALSALYFQFGRYLLISSSRPNGLPANLQGIWAEEVQAPWNADWHLNVNVQMNYWLAENTNLAELHEPLFSLISSLQKPGERTAKLYYNARGWVAHVITNLWGFTAPGEGANWGSTSTGAAWLCQHLWDHYLFTRDKEFLKRAYPVMKGSARFYADMLIEEPKNKWLVTALGNSPENAFQMPNGKIAHVAMGPTIDQQLLRYLFDACIEASKTLNTDAAFRKELSEKRARLAPTRVGTDGRVMEWLEEYKEPEPTHRHVSHLWGLYPGAEITNEQTPDLAAGARKTLERRGDMSTGWSLAYKLNLWARLGDGNRCDKLLSMLFMPVGFRKIEGVTNQGGSYDNLFDAHPPFQIDGNFGAAAGIAEMLMQSHNGITRLLPALPDTWQTGSVTGLRARGGFAVDVTWQDGKLSSVNIRSLLGESMTLRYGNKEIKLKTSKGKTYKFDAELKQK